jgi:hypothetical protein
MSTSAALLSLTHAKENIITRGALYCTVRFVTIASDNSYYHIMNTHIYRYSYSIAPKFI